MTYTHDTTCGRNVTASTSQKWADFTKWIKERSAGNAKVRPSRQIPLLAANAPWEDGGPSSDLGRGRDTARASGAGRAPALPGASPAPLVNRCISQHTGKIPVLGVKFEVYPRSVRVVRPVQLAPGVARGGKKAEIDGFSDSSKRRLRRVASESGEELVSQFCLTYQNERPSGGDTKQHLNAWLVWMRRQVEGFKYLWVLEFQVRGVPHFHVFMNVEVCIGSTLHERMAAQWHKITGEKSREHLDFHLHAKNWIGWDMGTGSYVCKYLDKERQKHVPDGFGWVGRFWGCSRGLMPKPCVYDVHEIRAMGGQNIECVRVNVSRETYGRDITHTLLRTLGNFAQSRRRYAGARRGRHISRLRSSRWVQDGAAVFNRLLEYHLDLVERELNTC